MGNAAKQGSIVIGRNVLASLAIGLLWSFLWITTRSTLLLPQGSFFELNASIICPTVMLFGIVATLAIVSAFRNAPSFRTVSIGCSISGIAGVCLLLAASRNSSHWALVMLGWLSFGPSSAFLVVLAIRQISALVESQEIIRELLLGMVFGSSFYLLAHAIGAFAPYVLVIAASTISPFLLKWIEVEPFEASEKKSAQSPIPLRSTWWVLGIAAIFGIAFGIVKVTVLIPGQAAGESLSFAAMAAVGAILYIVMYAIPRFSMRSWAKWCIPVFVISILFNLSSGSVPIAAVSIIASTGYRLSEIMLWLFAFDCIFNYHFTPTRFFSVFFLICVSGQMISFLAMSGLPLFAPDSEWLNSAILVVLASVLLFMHTALLTSKHHTSLMKRYDQPFGKDKQPAVSIENRCHLLALRNNLTAREEEVVTLLALGRSKKEIEDGLVVSGSTVKAHRYNIYKKLDVHSHDELMALIENTFG